MGSSEKRTRGPNTQTPWVRRPEDGLSVLRLALDTRDPLQRGRLESMFEDAFRLRRALQSEMRAAARAYWAAIYERERDPAAVRARLGLSRTQLEHAAYAHLNDAPHLRRFVTKALAMHLADSVWSGTERHLFRDVRGKRHGLPRIGRWHDFTRLPGRARSHTKARKWETFRLHGTLAGHRAAYDRGGDFVQPARMRPVESDAWWSYQGPLAIVFSGLAEGTLVLPVRLPTSPCNQPILDHHLADPNRWHKIDVVRRRDPHAPGGWRYEAHLMVLVEPYASPAARGRRANAAIATADRIAGVDVNVSKLAVASHDQGRALAVTTIARDQTQTQRDRGRARRERRRQRELERSRRAMNRAQYQLSKRQEKRARRRAEAGQRPIEVIPAGPRISRTNGVPIQRYRRDQLSQRYRRLRAAQAADAAAVTQARADHARHRAADLVAVHGYRWITEDVSIAAWSRSWGRALAAFSPGALLAAIDREARAVAVLAGGEGGVVRASTVATALSQHCPCGQRVAKRLHERVHRCPTCKLVGDRDAVSAVLASFVVLGTRSDPASARVDYEAAGRALPAIHTVFDLYSGWQDTLSESTDLSAREGSSFVWWTSTPGSAAVARRIVGMAPSSTPNEPGFRQTTSERRWMRTNLSNKHNLRWSYLRDSS